MALSWPLAAWVQPAPSQDTELLNQLMVSNLTAHSKPQMMAESAWPKGIIDAVAISGPWLVWTDQSRLPNSLTQPVLWHLLARNLKTGQQQTLAESAQIGDQQPPVPRVSGDLVAWEQYNGLQARTSNILLANLRTGAKQTLVAERHLGPMSLAGPRMSYVLYDFAKDGQSYSVKLMSMNTKTRVVTPFPEVGKVNTVTSYDAITAWQVYNSNGATALAVASHPGASACRATSNADSILVAGAGYIAFLRGDRVMVIPSEAQTGKAVVASHSPILTSGGLAADGLHLAWLQRERGNRTDLVVAQVTVSGRATATSCQPIPGPTATGV